MFNLEHYDLSDINTDNSPLNKLYEIFKQTLNPDLTPREFSQYLFGQHPERMELTFINQGEELAGFCTAAAYPRKVNGKKVVILRSAFGLLDRFKNGRFPLQGLFFKYIRYKLAHPFTSVYVAGFMANPLMYAMICKYTLRCYPRRNITIPPKVLHFKKSLVQSMRLDRKEVAPFVMKIHFQVRFKKEDLDRINSSRDKDVAYFLSINPGFQDQIGVMVLIPVTFSNMLYTLARYCYRKVVKRFSFRRKEKREVAVSS
jgi:hypothetical protein